MRRAVMRLVLAAIVVTIAACSATPRVPDSTSIPSPASAQTPGVQEYVVRKGDTLSEIAWRYKLDMGRIAEWNGLKPPYVIHVGQRLRIEVPPERAETVQSSASAPRQGAQTSSVAQPGTSDQGAKGPSPAQKPDAVGGGDDLVEIMRIDSAVRGAGRWRWPASGTVWAERGARTSVKIAGAVGQPVYPAASGTVVYAGSGLRGLGKVIIVQHGEEYLSAYGHNREILVGENDAVVPDRPIAEMGQVDARRPMLHFEIRHRGQPIDPLTLLPRP